MNHDPVAPEGWKPIETAPEDCRILLLVPTLSGKWGTSIQCTGKRLGNVWVIYNADEAVQRVDPTHWRELLSPPVSPDRQEPKPDSVHSVESTGTTLRSDSGSAATSATAED